MYLRRPSVGVWMAVMCFVVVATGAVGIWLYQDRFVSHGITQTPALFISDLDQFQIHFPALPVVKLAGQGTSAKRRVLFRTIMPDGISYAVLSEEPNDATLARVQATDKRPAYYAEVLDRVLHSGIGTAVISKQDLTFHQLPALRFTTSDDKQHIRGDGYIVYHGAHVYVVLVGSKESIDHTPQAENFFQSFEAL